MLGEFAVRDAEQVERDHRVGTETVVGAVERDQIAVGDHPRVLVTEALGQAGDEAAPALGTVGGEPAVLLVVGRGPAVYRPLKMNPAEMFRRDGNSSLFPSVSGRNTSSRRRHSSTSGAVGSRSALTSTSAVCCSSR
jgi:hypothetical protein